MSEISKYCGSKELTSFSPLVHVQGANDLEKQLKIPKYCRRYMWKNNKTWSRSKEAELCDVSHWRVSSLTHWIFAPTWWCTCGLGMAGWTFTCIASISICTPGHGFYMCCGKVLISKQDLGGVNHDSHFSFLISLLEAYFVGNAHCYLLLSGKAFFTAFSE